MEFEEMQKIWHSESNQTFYAIDEHALNKRISAKKKTAHRITNISELVVIFTYFFGSCILLATNLINALSNVFMYLTAAWMFITSIYAIVVRVRRIYSNVRFDRTMFGELDHAISLATHQVRFSQMLGLNSILVAVLTVLMLLESDSSIWFAVGMSVFFAGALYLSKWEINIYKRKKEELVQLKMKLEAS